MLLQTVDVDLITINSSLQVAMTLNDSDETEKRLEQLRYIEKVIDHARNAIKELKKCQDQK